MYGMKRTMIAKLYGKKIRERNVKYGKQTG